MLWSPKACFSKLIKSKLIIRAAALAVCALVLMPAFFTRPAYAIGDPDSIAILQVYVFRDLLEDGDQLYYCRYNVNYGEAPTENASDTYLMAIYDASNTAPLFTRKLNYYQENIISIYLDAESALTWGTQYYIRVMGSPAYFDPLTEGTNMRSRQISAGDFNEATEFGADMLAEAYELQVDWEITLLSNGVLNSTGTTYFTLAIPNINSMDSTIFSTSYSYPTLDPRDWSNTTYIDSLSENQGDKLQAAVEGFGDMLGLDEQWAGIWLVAMIYLTTAGVIYGVTKDPGISMLGGFPVVIICAWLGVGGTSAIFTAVMATAIIAGIIFGLHFIMSRFA